MLVVKIVVYLILRSYWISGYLMLKEDALREEDNTESNFMSQISWLNFQIMTLILTVTEKTNKGAKMKYVLIFLIPEENYWASTIIEGSMLKDESKINFLFWALTFLEGVIAC